MRPNGFYSPAVRGLTAALRQRINTGRYEAGGWVPAERALSEEFNVHRRIVRQAIAVLCEEGWLVCRPKCRPVIASVEARGADIQVTDVPGQASTPAAERLVGLIMWHGGFEPRAVAQQRIFWGFHQTLARRHFHGVFLDHAEVGDTEGEQAAREAERLAYALENRFAGIVFYPYAYRCNRELLREVARRVPVVLIDRQIAGVETDYVGIDNHGAVEDVMRHLYAQGHTRIAMISPYEPINTVQDRIAGYQAATRRAGIHFAELVITVNSPLEWVVFDHIFQLPESKRPTAVVCINDGFALRVHERLVNLGLRVPEDLALVGFDDLVRALPGGVGLTTVAQPFEEIGEAAARFLLERIDDPTLRTRHLDLPTSLIIRDSSNKHLGTMSGR